MRIPLNAVWDMVMIALIVSLVSICHSVSHVSTPTLLASSFMLAAVIAAHWVMHNNERLPSMADAAVLLFELMFLLLAPNVQLALLEENLVNTSVLNETYAVITNLLCMTFVLSYLLARRYILARTRRRSVRPPTRHPSTRLSVRRALLLVPVGLITVYLSTRSIELVTLGTFESSPAYLLEQKFFCFIPVPMLFMIVAAKRTRFLKEPVWILLFLFFLACVLVNLNPAIEKRNTLGPVYLGLLFLLVPGLARTSRVQITVLLLLMGVFFPLSSAFTHTQVESWDLKAILDPDLYFSHFLQLHYDAWANLHTMVELVDRQGIQLGRQLLGTFLFFVPHTLWETKPLATGIVIGQYLSANYQMDFDNLSAPLVAEAYVDLSVFGVVIAAVALAWVTRLLDKFCYSDNPLAQAAGIYFSLYLIFLLRGALMVAVAYGSGAALAFFAVDRVMRYRRKRARARIDSLPAHPVTS